MPNPNRDSKGRFASGSGGSPALGLNAQQLQRVRDFVNTPQDKKPLGAPFSDSEIKLQEAGSAIKSHAAKLKKTKNVFTAMSAFGQDGFEVHQDSASTATIRGHRKSARISFDSNGINVVSINGTHMPKKDALSIHKYLTS